MPFVKQCDRKEVRLAEAACTPCNAAATAASAAATTATSASAATATPTAATPATTTAAPRDLHLVADVLLVEEVERCQTHIGDFLLTEDESLGRREVQFLRRVQIRNRRC